MSHWFVSRHPGARQWAKQQDLPIDHWTDHLDASLVQPGDVVIGTLPVDKIAEVNARGARFLALCLNLDLADRGREFSAEDMRRLNGRLVEYRAERI